MAEALPWIRAQFYKLVSRLSGARLQVGRGLRARARLKVHGPGLVVIGDDVLIDRMPGDRSAFVTIFTHSPDAVVTVGDRARLYSARFSSRFRIDVGRDVVIEEAGITDTHFHSIAPHRGQPSGETTDRCRVVIGDRVVLGARSLVTPGVRVGDDVVVAPGAIVTRSLPPGCLAVGNPARPAKDGPP